MAWYDDSWTFRIKITVASSQVDANLADFPVYIDLSDLPAAFFTNVQTNGDDIRVTTSDGETECPIEIVSIDTGAETGELHFEAPSVSSSTDTDFYIYYGNAGASAYAAGDTFGRNAVWANGYAGVWHLQEEASGTGTVGLYIDSTGNGNDGDDQVSATGQTGQLGAGQEFDGTDDYIDAGTAATLNFGTGDFSFSLWFQSSDVNAFSLNKRASGAAGYEYLVGGGSTAGDTRARVAGDSGSADSAIWSGTDDGSYHAATATVDRTAEELKLYGDGSAIGSPVSTSGIGNVDTSQVLNFGARGGSSANYAGFLDEVRISSVARTASWISTEYNNQSAPATFYNIGTQQEQAGTDTATTAVVPNPPTRYQSEALTLAVHAPLVRTGAFLFDWREGIESWSHEIHAWGGYWRASATQNETLSAAEDWLANGLDRHVEVYDDSGVEIWEGFVNQVTLTAGGLSITRGPLLDVANKVKVYYSTIDTSNGGFGIRAVTAWAEDADSQDKYGELQQVLSSGGVTAGNAEQIRDTYLADRKEPLTSSRFELSGGDAVRVQIELLGYVHKCKTFVYSSASTGTENLSAQLASIIAADPNSVLSTDTTRIETNTLQVPAWEDDDPTAWEKLKGLTAMGDASDNRYTFGFYNGRRPEYDTVPTTFAYRRLLAEQGAIQTVEGETIKPWQVRAGRWLLFPDFLVGKTEPSSLRLDPRALYIERVTYTAPYNVSIDGGPATNTEQLLGRLGLSGIGG